MLAIYNLLLYQPLLNALIFLYNTIAFGDFGLSIIFLTILIRIILFPLFFKGSRQQVIMQRLQPHIRKIQIDHKHDKEKQTRAMLELYREHKVNPFSSIFVLFLQLLVLIPLYRIFLNSLKPDFLSAGDLYSFVKKPVFLGLTSFGGLINLGKPNIFIVVLAAIAQYFQARLALPKTTPAEPQDAATKASKSMVLMGPIITLIIFYGFPAAITLYWLATSIFSVLQQIIVNKSLENERLGTINKKTS